MNIQMIEEIFSVLTEELRQPVRLVVVLHGHSAGVEEDEDYHKPEPRRGLNTDNVSPKKKILINYLLYSTAVSRISIFSPVSRVPYLPHLQLQLQKRSILNPSSLFIKNVHLHH